jgi:hypothetical protein
MSSHKHVEMIRESIKKTSKLDESQKSDSMKRIEEWVLEDRAFGTLKEELINVSIFFEELFSELGIK